MRLTAKSQEVIPFRPHRALRRLLVVLLAVVPVMSSVVAIPVATAEVHRRSVDLPAGWSVAVTRSGEWELALSDTAVEMRDARVEFRLNGRVLGFPVEQGDRLVVVLDEPPSGDWSGLSAWQGGHRLDGPNLASAVVATNRTTVFPAADPAPIGSVDPAARGPFATATLSYSLDSLTVEGMPEPLEVTAEVIVPVDAPGIRPLVLFLHGRHDTCYLPAPDPDPELPLTTGDWPCPAPYVPIPSWLGYRYVADLLASQGYVTVSIAANGINGQDSVLQDAGMRARSILVRHHLALWEEWSRDAQGPFGDRFVSRLDMRRVVLVGHSRGGEGVELAAIDAPAERAPYRITGLALIAPTAFGRQVAPGVHTAVLLPYCDGDVPDLQGQIYVDNARDLLGGEPDPALHSAVMIIGANHNYFNQEWTPGQAAAPAADDWEFVGLADAPNCGSEAPERLNPAEQQAVGAVYIAALVRLAASGDQAVVPFLDGGRIAAESAGRAVVFTHAVGGNHQLVYRAEDENPLVTIDASAGICAGYESGDFGPWPGCAPSAAFEQQPHWLPMYSMETLPAPRSIRADWGEDGTVSARLDAPVDLTAVSHVDVRVALDPSSAPADLRVRFTDSTGATKLVRPELRRVDPLPSGGSPLPKTWAYTLRVDLRSVSAAMRPQIAAIGVFSNAPALGYILDISTRVARVGKPSLPERLPRVDVASLNVVEGDGPHTEKFVLQLTRTATRAARLWVQVVRGTEVTGHEVVIEPGVRRVEVPVEIAGNRVFDAYHPEVTLAVAALDNITVGRSVALMTIIEDDPPPSIEIAPILTDVAEGEALTWQVTLSEPMGTAFGVTALFTVPSSGRELHTDDFTADQLSTWFIDPAIPPIALSELGLQVPFAYFAPGETTATVTIATVADGAAEGIELLAFDAQIAPLSSTAVSFTASVRDV